MPLLKYRCDACQEVFEALVAVSRMEEVTCEACGSGEVRRAYEGKCLFGMAGSSAGRGNGGTGECADCPGGDHACGGGCACHSH